MRLSALELIDLAVAGVRSTAIRAEASLSLSVRDTVRSASTLLALSVRTIRAVPRACDSADSDRRIAKSLKFQYIEKFRPGIPNYLNIGRMGS